MGHGGKTKGAGSSLRLVGGWRSASLEVGGKGKIIADCGFRIADLKARSQESGVRIQEPGFKSREHGEIQRAGGGWGLRIEERPVK